MPAPPQQAMAAMVPFQRVNSSRDRNRMHHLCSPFSNHLKSVPTSTTKSRPSRTKLRIDVVHVPILRQQHKGLTDRSSAPQLPVCHHKFSTHILVDVVWTCPEVGNRSILRESTIFGVALPKHIRRILLSYRKWWPAPNQLTLRNTLCLTPPQAPFNWVFGQLIGILRTPTIDSQMKTWALIWRSENCLQMFWVEQVGRK